MDLSKAAIVVAHPDDEILWFGSLVARAGRVVMCYGPNPRVAIRGQQRQRVADAYPHRGLRFLGLMEPDVWRGRGIGPVESELARLDREDPAFQQALIEPLRDELRGVSIVFTHNPWGEYGHDDHRRVHAAVEALRDELKFDVFVPGYAERRVLPLMAAKTEAGIGDLMRMPVDRAVIDPIRDLYIAQDCWTWWPHWRWPEEEFFFRLGAGAILQAAPFHCHIFNT